MNKTDMEVIIKRISTFFILLLSFSACNNQVKTGGDEVKPVEQNKTSNEALDPIVQDTLIQDSSDVNSLTLRVACVDYLKLTDSYEYAKLISGQIKREQSRAQTKSENLRKDYQSWLIQEQSKYDLSTMTQTEQVQLSNKLGMMDQAKREEINKKEADLAQKMNAKQVKLMKKLSEKMTDFFKRYAKENNYDLILAKDDGGQVLFSKEHFDVTQDAIYKINAEYKAEKK